jgi:NADH-quinone oxidoreductase subunit H
MQSLFYIFIFPGFLFLFIFGLLAQFIDRKIYARLQNRIGPPWFQPLADFIKLIAKEDLVPTESNPRMFRLAPIFALTAVITAMLYIPTWNTKSVYPFTGDTIIILYLLTIPTLAIFVGGWYSTSLYARIGSMRALNQLFAYEVPLFMGILASALLADTWSISEINVFYSIHPWLCLTNIIGFGVSIIALMGKLEKTPFDIPEAETEIVAGSFVEYSGKLFALLRLSLDIEMIVGSAFLVSVFLPFGMTMSPVIGIIIFITKILAIVILIAILRTIFARLRIDQMISFCWKYMVPLALLQLLINLVLKGVIFK